MQIGKFIRMPLRGFGMLWASPYTVLGLWLMGRRPYVDNPFERQAYAHGGGDK